MTNDSLISQQVENQKEMSKQLKDKRAAQASDTRRTIGSLLLALLIMQGIDMFFATETVRQGIVIYSKEATVYLNQFFTHLVDSGSDCEARGDSSRLCSFYVSVLHKYNEETKKEAIVAVDTESQENLPSELMHVVQGSNLTSLYDETTGRVNEVSDHTTTLIKTTEVIEQDEDVITHPLLRFILHNPYFLQLALPFFITFAAIFTQRCFGNATANMAYFMLSFFFFARLFLALY